MLEKTQTLLNDLKSSNDDVRRASAEELRLFPTEEVIGALVATLGDFNRGVAEAAENSLSSIRGATVIKKVIPLLNSHEPKLRNFSFEMLCEIGNDSIYDIIALLKDSDKDLRKFGVDILGELASGEAVQALIIALDDSDVNVAAASAESLGKIKDINAIPSLIKKLDSETWMQCSVIKSLSMFNDQRASDEVCTILPKLKGMALFSAISALKEAGCKGSIPMLISMLNESNKALRGSIITALEKIIEKEGKDSIEIDANKINMNELIEVLADPQIQTKISAINILGWLKREEAVKHLINEIILTETNPEVAIYKEDIKTNIFNAMVNIKPKDVSYIISTIESSKTPDAIKAELIDVLGKIKSGGALESLLKLKDTNSAILKRVLAKTLGEFNHPSAIEALKRFLKDSEGHTRGNSANSLGNLKAEEATDDLIAVFKDGYKNIREDAANALAKIGTPIVIEKLKNILDGASDSENKRLAIFALGKMTSASSTKILVDHLKDSDPQVRKITVEAISEQNAKSYSDKLIQMIDDNNFEVKIAAIKGLSKCDARMVVFPLIKALKQENNVKIRYHIVEALGDLKAIEAVQSLIELLNDQSSVVVLSTVESLGKIKDKRAMEPLKKLFANADREIAATAQEACNKITSEQF